MRFLVWACLIFVVTSPVQAARRSPPAQMEAAKPELVVDTTAPTITHSPAGACPSPVESVCLIEATIVDDSGVFDPTLLFRLKGSAAFDRVAMKPTAESGRYQAAVPAAIVGAGDVEYLIEAFDIEGNGPARAGTEASPLLLLRRVNAVVVAPPPPPPPEDNSGVVIGVVASVAAVVVAIGVGFAVYALRPPAPEVIAVNVEATLPFAAASP